MRLAALAGLALALAVAAVLLITGSPLPVGAADCPLCKDDIQVEMLQGGQPETLFPAGTKTVAGQVKYNVRDENGNPVSIAATVGLLDPVGIQVYTDTFQTQSAPYTGYATHAFGPVSADQMFTVYRSLGSSGVARTLTEANAIPEPTATVTATTASLIQIGRTGQAASQTALAVQRLLTFAEVTGATRTQLQSAQTELQKVSQTADTVVSAGLNQPDASYRSNVALIKASAAAAKTAYDAAAPALAGLSNLNIPATDACRQTVGPAVPTTYTTNVSAKLVNSAPSEPPLVRDSWELQVGTPTAQAQYGSVDAAPMKIYTIDVSVATTRTAAIQAVILDGKCLPVPDGMTIGFRTTLGSLDPVTVTTKSVAGAHGIAETTLRSGNTAGNAQVTLSNVISSTDVAAVTIVGPAFSVSFLSSSPTRYIGAGSAGNVFSVQVRDAASNAVADGTQVQFSVTNSAGTFTAATVGTVNGFAQTTFTANSTLGAAQVSATALGTSATATQPIVIVGPPAANGFTFRVTQGYSSTVYINGQIPYLSYTFVEVDVRDSQSQPVADGTSVTLQLGNTDQLAWEPPDTLPPNPPSATKLVMTSGGKAQAKMVVLSSAAPGEVPVIARVTDTPAIQRLLTITIEETPTYTIFMPAIFKNVVCGAAAGDTGCYSPPRKADQP